ncbi:MAG TPA: DUF3541 domain-containing protein [Legionella sp.]|nr:DUF3541 domain-containing protein [Legionella sp.]
MRFLFVYLSFFCTLSHGNIGARILKNYQSHLYALPVIQQEHFAVRMYALTNNEVYLNPIINYIYLLAGRYKYLVKNINNKTYMENENKRLLLISDLDTDKAKSRKEKSLKFPNIAYYLNLLILTNKIHSYHLQGTPLFPDTSIAINFLKSREFELQNFILDHKNIKIYGAQLINYVYFLYDLGISDLRKSYADEFQKIFPNKKDYQLSNEQYSAKIYGMTHFIISASRFYQKELNPHSFEWITYYFRDHIDEIINRTENDVIVEVGVSLRLVQNSDIRTVNKIKSYLDKVYSRTYRMIPDKKNSYDLIKGEHRNILTIMLFNWPDQLTPTPNSLIQTMLKQNFILTHDGTKLIYGIGVPY